VVTIFSMFFAGISGSSAADVAILSRTLAPEMKREGYNLAFTAALIASASTMANLIPPASWRWSMARLATSRSADFFWVAWCRASSLALG